MTTGPGPFRPDELAGGGATPPEGELGAAYATAREVEHALAGDAVRPSADFVARVMAAVATEPAPRPAGFFGTLRRTPSLAGLTGSVREAWAVATRGSGRPLAARGMAMAYVLAVLLVAGSLTSVAALGTVGALRLLIPEKAPAPTLDLPSPLTSPAPSEAVESPNPSATDGVDPSASPEPDESGPDASGPAGATDTPRPSGSSDPSASPEPSDSEEPSGSPEASDDSGGSGSPSDSPDPSETPH